jgi:hypothetical protein
MSSRPACALMARAFTPERTDEAREFAALTTAGSGPLLSVPGMDPAAASAPGLDDGEAPIEPVPEQAAASMPRQAMPANATPRARRPRHHSHAEVEGEHRTGRVRKRMLGRVPPGRSDRLHV